jgi:SulP family sulfate permease
LFTGIVFNRQGFNNPVQLIQLLPSLTTGALVGTLGVVYGISFATLIFSGELAPFVMQGIGLTLFGTFILGLVTARFSSFSGHLARTQDAPAAILGLIGAAIVSRMPASATAGEIFGTVVAAMVLTTLLCGLFFFCVGRFKLGRLARLMPYPVMGGFLAGTGWLIAAGAVGMMADIPLTRASLLALVQPALLLNWLPGLFFGGVLLLLLRRYHHFLLLPGLLLAASALFYLLLYVTNTSIGVARSQGWLFEAVSGGVLWQPQTLLSLGQAHWTLLFGQVGTLGVILLVSLMAVLLNLSGVALATKHEIDLDRELQVTGLANLLAGLGGSPPGYTSLSLSILGHRLGGHGRLISLISAGMCGFVLFFGASLITLLPKPVLGGVLVYLGLSLMVEWVYDAWFKLSKAEYGLGLLILAIIAGFGFLTGVALGLVVAVGIFVIRYSQVNVVKQTFSGHQYRSNVRRSPQQAQMIRQQGQQVHILALQGFIFFGTAHHLLDQVQQRLNQSDLARLRFVLLDFRLVTGLDSSATLIFNKLKYLAEAHDLVLVFTHLNDEIRRQLGKDVFTRQDHLQWCLFPDLDHGLEWCEAQLIEPTATMTVNHCPMPHPLAGISDLLAENGQPLLNYLERLEIAPKQTLIEQGTPSTGIYFIESGQVTVWLTGEDGSKLRLSTMSSGAVVGEVSWYLGQPASASVIADEVGLVYYLSAANLRRMEYELPALAVKIHTFVAGLLSERIARMNEVVQVLQH